jgi:hypothetical protein
MGKLYNYSHLSQVVITALLVIGAAYLMWPRRSCRVVRGDPPGPVCSLPGAFLCRILTFYATGLF